MTIRSRRETVATERPFRLRGIDRLLLAATHNVITDPDQIDGLSSAAFRRIATMIEFPTEASSSPSTELLTIGPVELADLGIDAEFAR